MALALLPGTAWAADAPASGSGGEALTGPCGNSTLDIEEADNLDGADLATPQLSGVKANNSDTSITVTWDAVNGASKYRVFYRTGSGNWTVAGDTASTEYTWSGAQDGVLYTFTVRCTNSAGTSYASAFDTAGKSITYSESANQKFYYTMRAGESRTLQNPASSSGLAFYAYTWFSADSSIVSESHVTNSSSSTVTACKPGMTKVTAYLDGQVAYEVPHQRYNSITKRWETYYTTSYYTVEYKYVYYITVV